MNFDVPTIHTPFRYSVNMHALMMQYCIGGRNAGTEPRWVSAEVEPGKGKLIVVKADPDPDQFLDSRRLRFLALSHDVVSGWAYEKNERQCTGCKRQSKPHTTSWEKLP
jgi:hypothetical protein